MSKTFIEKEIERLSKEIHDLNCSIHESIDHMNVATLNLMKLRGDLHDYFYREGEFRYVPAPWDEKNLCTDDFYELLGVDCDDYEEHYNKHTLEFTYEHNGRKLKGKIYNNIVEFTDYVDVEFVFGFLKRIKECAQNLVVMSTLEGLTTKLFFYFDLFDDV